MMIAFGDSAHQQTTKNLNKFVIFSSESGSPPLPYVWLNLFNHAIMDIVP
jgi:hypothetical protein